MAKNKPKNNQSGDGTKTIALNRKARHEYIFEEFFQCGIVLMGTEVKSLRAGRVNLGEAYAQVEKGEVWLKNMQISHWETGNRFNHEPFRSRKLLLHAKEIRRLIGKTKEKGLTLVPTRLYFCRGYVKVEIALARGKKMYDKREAEAAKSAKRAIDRAIKSFNR
ncbi:SsrA-binding protein SmpB [bacterium]|nr:SsrA-binding protein SmpB [bacterium]